MDRKGHSKLKGKPALLKKYHKVNNVEVELFLDPGHFEPIGISFPGIDKTMHVRFESIKAARLFQQLNNFSLDVFRKLIQKVGKGEIKGMIKKAPELGLNGDMNLEAYSGDGNVMKPEGASEDGDRYNIEFNNGSVAL